MTQHGASDVLALGFGTTVAMWGLGYLGRLPGSTAPSWLIGIVLLVCLAAGGFVAGRTTGRGWAGGAQVGLLASALNLLVLGSVVASHEPNRVVPSALWGLPGSLLLGALLGGLGGAIGAARPAAARARNWTGAFAAVAAAATFLLLAVGGLVTSHAAGLAVVDWPNSFGYNMFLYPLARMTGGIYFEHAHRLFGSLVGVTVLALALHLQRSEPRAWVRRLAWLALGMVVVQGVLGGLRVTGRFTLSTSPADVAPSLALAIVHGVLGQLFFAVTVGLAVATSTTWRSERQPAERASATADRQLSAILIGVVFVQLVLGALQRPERLGDEHGRLSAAARAAGRPTGAASPHRRAAERRSPGGRCGRARATPRSPPPPVRPRSPPARPPRASPGARAARAPRGRGGAAPGSRRTAPRPAAPRQARR
jgi:hypothetical protein